ncbi:MAG TPA: adenylate/guanylate cyclase domain-containing protein [Terrimicrobiaceae bacterium]
MAVLTATLIAAFLYRPLTNLFMDLMRTNVLSIAATAGAMLDAEIYKKIRTRTDQESPEYKQLESELRRARDANRRRDLYVKYIYTMRPYSQDPRTAEFVMDAEEEGVNKSNIGDIYKSSNPNYNVRFNEFQADEEFVHDQWGLWLTANAPIRDAANETVGALGVDVSATEALHRMTALFWHGALALGVSLIAAYLISSFASRRIAQPLLTIRNAVERISAGDYSQNIKLSSKDEFGEVATALNKMTLGLQEREDLKSALGRYVSEDILNEIIYAGKPSELYSMRRKVTALFADVRGFTNFSEQLSPEETVTMLNDYFEKMIEAVFKNTGHLNKFMGDGLMALFGALRDDEFQEEHAVQAALDMRKALKNLQEKWAHTESRARDALTSLRIGIGVNTGLAIVGNIGSKQRMEFTAIGDSINLASRLEQATRERQVDILVSEYSYVAARSRFPFVPTGEISIKGKSESVRTYTISIPA